MSKLKCSAVGVKTVLRFTQKRSGWGRWGVDVSVCFFSAQCRRKPTCSHVIPTASYCRKRSAITGTQPAAMVSLHNPLFGGILLVKVLRWKAAELYYVSQSLTLPFTSSLQSYRKGAWWGRGGSYSRQGLVFVPRVDIRLICAGDDLMWPQDTSDFAITQLAVGKWYDMGVGCPHRLPEC